MCGSMVDIQSPTAEIRRGKRRKKEERQKPQLQNMMACPLLWEAIKLITDSVKNRTLLACGELCLSLYVLETGVHRRTFVGATIHWQAQLTITENSRQTLPVQVLATGGIATVEVISVWHADKFLSVCFRCLLFVSLLIILKVSRPYIGDQLITLGRLPSFQNHCTWPIDYKLFSTRNPAIAEGPRDAGVPVEIW